MYLLIMFINKLRLRAKVNCRIHETNIDHPSIRYKLILLIYILGIMRRCLFGWREGSYNFRTKFSKAQTDQLSNMLIACNKTKPIEIQRAIRSLKSLKFWKGSEYRIFLFYLGPVFLNHFLAPDIYNHFLKLSCAVMILSCNEYLKYIEIAKTLLDEYIEQFIDIYGIDAISSNVHNLCHVIDDVKKFGHLPLISSYPFENFIGQLKHLVRHGNLPLSQVAKRCAEMSKINIFKDENKDKIFVKKKINEKHELPMCNGVYAYLNLTKDFVLRTNDKNKWFMTKGGDIVKMLNATYFKQKIHIFGERVNNKYDFFVKPFASSKINIFASKIDEHSSNMVRNLYSLSDIKCKIFCIEISHNEFVFLPLIHTLDIKFII